VQAVADLGYTQPTAVQRKAIPLAMGEGPGRRFIDLMVSSQTGSGKTAAFLLPVLHTCCQQQAEAEAARRIRAPGAEAAAPARRPQARQAQGPHQPRNFKAAVPGALVLCPTRELAQQVAHDAIDLVKHCRGLRIANVVGGMPYQLQIAKLQNADLVVATPGRLLDLQRSMQIKLDKVQFLVVDEADRMLDLGFSDDLAEINQLTSQRKQTMMFSATFAPRIQQLAMRVMHDSGATCRRSRSTRPRKSTPTSSRCCTGPTTCSTSASCSTTGCATPPSTRPSCLPAPRWSATACRPAAGRLLCRGTARCLSQGLRNRRLMALRKGQVQILVATDVAARGIDVPTITHVFNFGLPMKAEDYTHRIGRTGRAGRDGWP
jgi:superfamily II DNA/RNA helicase